MTAVQVVALVVALLVGACIGSFANVIIDRMPLHLDEPNEFGEEWDTNRWSSVVGGESRCSSCGAPIKPYHLIPIVSWFILRGKCRECGDRIPAFHPFVELAVPAIGFGLWASLGWGWRLVPMLWLVPVGVAIAMIDLRTLIVPTRVVWPAFGVMVALSVASALAAHHPRWLFGALISMAVLAGPLMILWILIPSGMGFGDVRLAVLVGWSVGFAVTDHRLVAGVYAALTSLVVAAVLGLVLGFVAVGARGLKAKVPFGPPLIAAALLCIGFAPHVRSFFRL